MSSFPYLRVNGKALERGRQIGERAKEQIIHNIQAYKQIFMDSAGVDWETATKRAAEYIPWIEQYDPEIMQEIVGISEGANLPLLHIVALNARSEIILNSDGCTSLAALPEATTHNQTLLGQNWDWNQVMQQGVIILEIEQFPRPTILMATEAGIVGKIGMNSEGLGICLNLLGTASHTKGVPIHIVLRGILNSRSISQAVGQVGRMPRGTAANFLIAHKEGTALDIETTSDDYDILYPVEGVISHTNHFIGRRMTLVKDISREMVPDTHIRYWRSQTLLLSHQGHIDSQTIKDIFTDHIGNPDSICRHGEQYPIDLGRPSATNTVFSIIMNLHEGSFELSAGQPCTHEYQLYRFSHGQSVEHSQT